MGAEGVKVSEVMSVGEEAEVLWAEKQEEAWLAQLVLRQMREREQVASKRAYTEGRRW